MATGGMALLLSSQPHTFNGLITIGKIVYVFDIAMFLTIVALITYRFVHYPGTLVASITHPSESIFYATSWLSLNSIISCMGKYGVPSSGEWLVTVYHVLFWVYFALTFATAVFHYYLLFTSPSLKVQDATPAWDLPIFPFMLCGTIATVGVPFQRTLGDKMTMLVAGLTAQGLGMLVSILMFTIYFRRMIQFGLPSPGTRPAMFISVGPPSFTSLAIIGLARGYPQDGTYFGDVQITRQVVLILATFTAVFIWSLAFWFFCISLVANLAAWRELKFKLNWW
jgi:C4-dicarboxylate transporter/malic acid transport protein